MSGKKKIKIMLVIVFCFVFVFRRPQRSQRYHVESGKKREWQHLETTAVAIDASASVLASNNGRQSYHYGDLKFRTGRMEAILCGIYSSFATSFLSFVSIVHKQKWSAHLLCSCIESDTGYEKR